MFRVKICGITRAEDATIATRAGADAIGLNFYERSPRFVSQERAQEIVGRSPPGPLVVGVFVDTPAFAIQQIAERTPLGAVQLHGDQPPQMVAELAPLPVIRAFRCRVDLAEAAAYLLECQRIGHLPVALLVDAYVAGEFGGSGQMADWEMIYRERNRICGLPLILAGGLGPDNVAAAIEAVRPTGVDAASLVEESPGIKSEQKVVAFVQSALAAFAKAPQNDPKRDG